MRLQASNAHLEAPGGAGHVPYWAAISSNGKDKIRMTISAGVGEMRGSRAWHGIGTPAGSRHQLMTGEARRGIRR